MMYKVLFELFQKLHLQTYASQFMTSICHFQSAKCGTEGKNTKIRIS